VIGVCDGQPSSVTEALHMLDRTLDYLNTTDTASLPSAAQAETLRALERAGAKHTAARARVLAAFAGQAAYEDDGQGSARAWLRWQTRITTGAAAGAVGWARRIAAHPVIGDALAAGELSESWARQLCAWSDRLPLGTQSGADEILAAAARGGVDLAGLAGLAQEMYERSHDGRGDDGDDGFADRAVWLDTTLGGAGRLTGDLTPGCAAALTAVLESLAKRAGPEDVRTAAQRRHDALAEACRRLVASGMLPARAGQPTQVIVHMSLAQLRGLPGASATESAWAAARAAQPGWLTGPEAEAAACDASMVPVVAGQVDWAAVDHLTEVYRSTRGLQRGPATEATRQRLARAVLALAISALSGPGGLAAQLRTGLTGAPLTSASLPLDMGPATETIPAHLRRAVTTRHPHCAFPGCTQPASACDIHHVMPRSRGGPTTIANLVPLCAFHHLTAVHRWGWTLRLNADATTTATSPDGRVLHSHGPPGQAAQRRHFELVRAADWPHGRCAGLPGPSRARVPLRS
jgi:Domain of unknown function (DUF222)/HNH endonuclease